MCCPAFPVTESTGEKHFSIPKGKAQKTLKMAAVQGEVDLISLRSITRGVETAALDGHFEIMEVFAKLLEGSPLVVVYRSEINAYTVVKRDSESSASDTHKDPTNDESIQKMIKLRTLSKKVNLSLAAAGFAVGTSAVNAQDENGDEEIFELSPFTVDANDQDGYRATTTLAGTRIKTELKDLGSAISVVTEGFLEDTGSTNIEDVLSYLTNTEVGGAQGNFSGTEASGFVPDQDEARSNPQSTARVRGLQAPNYTRSYFSTNIPVDSYNTGSITINRGANSLLFGLGSPSGVVNTDLKGPVLSKDTNKFSFRTDEHGSFRGTFDVNRVIIPERLAIRVAGVHDDKQFKQEPAYDRTQRFTGSFKGILFKNENSSFLGNTTLRGNFEIGNTKRTPPDSIAPIIAYESFFTPPPDTREFTGQDYTIGLGYDNLAAGWTKWQTTDTRPVLLDTPGEKLDFTSEIMQGAAAPGLDAYYEEGAWASIYNVDPNDPDSLDVYQIRWNETVATNFNTAHFFNDVAIVVNTNPIANRTLQVTGDLDAQGAGFIDGFHGRLPLPGGPWGTHVNTRLYVEGPQGLGFAGNSLQDTNVFDYKNNIITGDLQKIERDFDVSTVVLEQAFFEGKGGIELVLDEQSWEQSANQPFGGGGRNLPIYIDGAEYLPNGQPNPNVGRAMMITRGMKDNVRRVDRKNWRATGFYELDFADFSDGFGKWFGKHNFTGLLQEEDTRTERENFGLYWAGNDFNYSAALNNSTSDNVVAGAGVTAIAYLSDNNIGKELEDVRLTPLSADDLPQEGDSYRIFYYDRKDQANLKEGTVTATRLRDGGSANRSVVASEAVAWQSYLFGGHIVGLLGWRTDEIDSYGRIDSTTRELNNEWSLENLALKDPVNTRGSTTTWSVVGHLPQKYIEKLGPITSVSAHYGVGENFSAILERNNIFGEPFDNPSGETTEYGITLGIADKWFVKFNKYETSSNFATANGTGVEQPIAEITGFLNNWQDGINNPDTFPFDGDSVGPTSAREAGFTSYQQMIDAMLAAIPEPTKSILNYQYDAEDESWERDNIANLREVTDVVAEGLEIEIVGNPTKNWRISANVAQTETTRSNSANALFEFNQAIVANMIADGRLYNPVLRQSVDSAVGWVERWTQDVITPLAGTRAKDGTVSQEQREWRVNIVNNYTFREGRFKGLSIGGALKWQDEIATGYGIDFDEFGNQIPDLNNVFIGDSQLNGDLWFAYKRKLGDKLNWKIQLNIRNIIGDQDDIVTVTNPDGHDAQYRLAPERTWFLTNTFEF